MAAQADKPLHPGGTATLKFVLQIRFARLGYRYIPAVAADETILGIEGGGTKTAWVLVKGDGILDSGKLPASNLRLTTPEQLAKIFRALPGEAGRVGIFLAGCGTPGDRAQLLRLGREVWPSSRIVVGSDREAGLAACLQAQDGIVVNAGTGSSVTGRRGGRIEKAGGWGHILGDAGGAYFVSIRALRLILREYDLRRGERKFAGEILAALGLNHFDELVRWVQTAGKTEIASLAPVVFAAAGNGDEAVQEIIEDGAQTLADFTAATAARLLWDAPEVRLMGGLFERQPSYATAFCRALVKLLANAKISRCASAPELGAAWLAANKKWNEPPREMIDEPGAAPPLTTEEIDPVFGDLEKLSALQLVDLFVAQEKTVAEAIRAQAHELGRALEVAADTLRRGGRMFYVGAGTSGRVGVLDAAEIPPTFGAPPDLVQGIIAGGASALQRSVEGAEDDERGGALTMDERDVSASDLVLGISASGRAPFVLGALRRARIIGAKTILLTCNPKRAPAKFDLEIHLPTGAEVVAGSTRLKAGSATKIALNIISTGAMIQLGRVRGNLMIDLQPSNKKLRQRAVRLVARLAECDQATARAALERSHWDVRLALGEKISL